MFSSVRSRSLSLCSFYPIFSKFSGEPERRLENTQYTKTLSPCPNYTNRRCWHPVTGGSKGIGYETAKTLYHLNGTVYITSRSTSSAESAITSIKASSPHPSQTSSSGKGKIDFIVMNFSDLSTIKQAAKEFLSKVNRIDVIIHNAGVMLPDDPNETTAQGWHQQLGINALAPFLLQLFLTPLLLHTAALPATPPNSVRVIFLSSSGHRAAPLPDGITWSDINLAHSMKTGLRRDAERYGQSKAMNCMFAYEFARRYQGTGSGIVSLSLHPGALKTVSFVLSNDTQPYMNREPVSDPRLRC